MRPNDGQRIARAYEVWLGTGTPLSAWQARPGERAPWLAIDPKPLVGDPAYDVAWLARDRLETLAAAPSPGSAGRRRLGKLADALDLDRDRLRGWTLFRCVVAGVRCLATGDRPAGELLMEFAGGL